MKYNQPFDQPSNPEASYIDGNPVAGIQGSIVPAASIEYPQRELVNLTLDTNLSIPSNSDMHQLSRGVQAGRVNYALDQGIPNALAIVLQPLPLGYFDGLRVFVKAAYRNTGRATLAIGPHGAREVIRYDGTGLLDGDILPGAIQEYAYDAIRSKWQLMNTSIGGFPFLQQNLTIYVNWDIGNDSNDGISNTVGHALKTPQGAVNLAFSYPPSQYTITVIIADSQNYPGFVTPTHNGPHLHMIGNVANPQNVKITGNDGHACWLMGLNEILIEGVTVTTTLNAAGPGGGFVVSDSGLFKCYNNRSLYVAGAVFEGAAGTCLIGNHRWAGNSAYGVWATVSGVVAWIDSTTNYFDVPITMSYFCLCTTGGNVTLAPTEPVWVGFANVTAVKYNLYLNGTVNTGGAAGGVNYFPGNVAGGTSTGGQYL